MKPIHMGVLAHVDAGKTTVTEAFLVHSGIKQRMGRVDSGTTTTDSMALERQRGVTIRASTISFYWKGQKINLIDTPGHVDFIAEVERSLAILDGAVLVLSAKEGVQPQTRVLFEALQRLRIPTILFINKIDRVGACTDAVCADIQAKMTTRIVRMQHIAGEGARDATVCPLGDASIDLLEAIVMRDDALLAAYLADQPISSDACLRSLHQAVQECALFPVYAGSALHDIGIDALMDAIALYCTGSGDEKASLSAMVYKALWSETGQKQVYLRLFSGTLRLREKIPVVNRAESVHIKALCAVTGDRCTPVHQIHAGDIAMLPDSPLRCGDFLGAVPAAYQDAAKTLPLLTVGIAPGSPADRSRLLSALQQLSEEDPFLHVHIHAQTGEISVRLYGAFQREILEAMLLERYGLAVKCTPLMTLYKEKPATSASAEIRIGAQANLHQAGIALTIEPLPAGAGNRYETLVSYGALEKPFQNAVDEGVRMGLSEGLGFEITDTRVLFTDMDYSSVTSTPADFRRLAPQVIRKALEAAGRTRVEPWLAYTVRTPTAMAKKVIASLSKLGATLNTVQHGETECSIEGEAPLDTTKEFAVTLMALTQGTGIFSTRFAAYRETPNAQ